MGQGMELSGYRSDHRSAHERLPQLLVPALVRQFTDELHTRTRETKRLVSSNQIRFTDDSPEGQFVREKVTTLIRQIRNQAAKLRTGQGESDPALRCSPWPGDLVAPRPGY
jgi:hypothetical protein